MFVDEPMAALDRDRAYAVLRMIKGFRAYVAFWGMCLFAITISRLIVKPILLAGPPADGYNSSCPPYERVSIIACMYTKIYLTNSPHQH